MTLDPSIHTAVRCRGLVKRYSDVVAVNGLDLEVLSGECFGLLGPNGAGKTTTIEILEGLTEPDAGEVEILGSTWTRNGKELRERLGISLQETQLTEKLTVEETVRLFRSFYKNGRDPEDVLTRLSLEEKRDARVGKLSGGQKQRLAVACALVGDPEVLFLDEPTTGLDPQSRAGVWGVLRELVDEGTTLVLTTQYLEEADHLADEIVVVDKGKVIAAGTPTQLKDQAGRASVVVTLTNAADLGTAADLMRPFSPEVHVEPGSRRLTAQAGGLGDMTRIAAVFERSGIELDDLGLARPSLDDVFLHLTGHRAETAASADPTTEGVPQ